MAETPPKIIFLDMDGVLCTIRSHIGQDQHGMMEALDREAVGLLNRLAEAGDVPARYVLSSTWRMIHDRAWMEDHLRKFGWRGEFHEDWRTNILNGHRGDEVFEWLSRHPEVTDWVAIDDDSDFLEGQKPRLALTDCYDGFLWQHFLNACKILHGNPEAWHRPSAPLRSRGDEMMTKNEFCARFKAEMLRIVTWPTDGIDVAAYADDVAPTYYDEPHQRADGPEECARTDISYWGE